MNPIAQWIVWFGLGAANALLFGIGGVIVAVILQVLALRIALRGDTLSTVSGLLFGFGTTWLALIGRQAATGGSLDDPGPWLTIGIVPVSLSVVFAVLRLVRWGGPARGAGR